MEELETQGGVVKARSSEKFKALIFFVALEASFPLEVVPRDINRLEAILGVVVKTERIRETYSEARAKRCNDVRPCHISTYDVRVMLGVTVQ
jgi:hypothetical protein